MNANEIFERLKSADLNLILAVETRAMSDIRRCLRARHRGLDELAQWQALGELSRLTADQTEEIARWQGEVVQRNKRIAVLIAGFYNDTKKEFLAGREGKAATSPYLRKSPTRGRMTV